MFLKCFQLLKIVHFQFVMLFAIFNLNRQIDGVAPTFVKKPAIRQEDDGKRLLFECKIKADPKPSVTWSHNTVPVEESKRHKVSLIDQ